MSIVFVLFVVFFKQKTADEMRMSDWSSDVCSSDLGLFGLSEVIASIRGSDYRPRHDVSLRAMLPHAREWKPAILATLRGAGFGCFFGPLPGTGPTVATIASYATERRLSRRPEEFGEGAIEGIDAPESANNAGAPTAFVPTLAHREDGREAGRGSGC